MKNRPIHENLDTSFVNLSALVRYLRRRQFAGNVRVELGGYEADIALSAAGAMRVREHDRVAGRISEGEEALQRLLIRAREPGGIINVYQADEELTAAIEKTTPIVEKITGELSRAAEPNRTVVSLAAQPAHRNGNSRQNGNSIIAKAETTAEIESPIEDIRLQPPPLEFSNKYEEKAKQSNLPAPEDWQMVLNLTAELLNTIDKSLAEANLEFASAFEKARAEISADYPFLNPADDIFDYKNGKIIVRRQINARLFAASINEALRRILEKLGRNPKFSNVYLITTHRILALIEKRRPLYDKFSITPPLARIIGI